MLPSAVPVNIRPAEGEGRGHACSHYLPRGQLDRLMFSNDMALHVMTITNRVCTRHIEVAHQFHSTWKHAMVEPETVILRHVHCWLPKLLEMGITYTYVRTYVRMYVRM